MPSRIDQHITHCVELINIVTAFVLPAVYVVLFLQMRRRYQQRLDELDRLIDDATEARDRYLVARAWTLNRHHQLN